MFGNSVRSVKSNIKTLGRTMNVLAHSAENKWGVWISGTGDFVNISGVGRRTIIERGP
jgi:hypothetical protein